MSGTFSHVGPATAVPRLQFRDRSSAVQHTGELRLLARTRKPGDHRILVMRFHLPALDHGVMDQATARSLIRINGQ
jgi:hypothetical protein